MYQGVKPEPTALPWISRSSTESPHGGWCPRGRKAEDGPIDPRYLLKETPSSAYISRDSDGTVVFSIAPRLMGGALRAAILAHKHGNPVIIILRDGAPASPEKALLRFIKKNKIKVLNVAGTRASKEPEIAAFVKNVLERTLI